MSKLDQVVVVRVVKILYGLFFSGGNFFQHDVQVVFTMLNMAHWTFRIKFNYIILRKNIFMQGQLWISSLFFFTEMFFFWNSFCLIASLPEKLFYLFSCISNCCSMFCNDTLI